LVRIYRYIFSSHKDARLMWSALGIWRVMENVNMCSQNGGQSSLLNLPRTPAFPVRSPRTSAYQTSDPSEEYMNGAVTEHRAVYLCTEGLTKW